ncbi:hypothetical protein [Streptomyces sp. TE5632]
MRAAPDGVGGEVVTGGAQLCDEAVVHVEVGEAAAGHRPAGGAVRREAEVAHGQPYVPAAVGVGRHLDSDLGCVLLLHLAAGTALVVLLLQEPADR